MDGAESTVVSGSSDFNDWDRLKSDKVIAIYSYGRGGSVLVQSLLDNHPNLIVTPGLLLSDFYLFYDEHKNLPPPELIDQFLTRHSTLFNPNSIDSSDTRNFPLGLNSLGPERNQCFKVDREVFAKSLRELVSDTSKPFCRKTFFLAIHLAYARASATSHHEYLAIVFPIHVIAAGAAQFMEDFPNAYHLFCIRDPIQSFCSFYVWFGATGLPHLLENIFFGGRLCDHAPCNANARALKLEDLHVQPRQTLERLVRWLDIPWSDSLMESTFQGLQWWGGSKSPLSETFCPERVQPKSWPFMPQGDLDRLQFLLRKRYEVWKYPLPSKGRNRFLFAISFPVLLLVPLRVECDSYIAFRESSLNRCRQQLAHSFSLKLCVKLIYWLTGLGMLKLWFAYRKLYLQSLLDSTSNRTAEVEVL